MDTPEPLPPVTPDDIAAAERLHGRPATTDAHHALLAPLLTTHRERLAALRTTELADRFTAPATVFRPLLPAGLPDGPGAGVTFTPVDPLDPATWDGTIESLAFASVTTLVALLGTRRVSSRQLTELFLRRLKQYGPGLFCVINLVPDADALRDADRADAEIAAGNYRGPLHGVPYGAKDLMGVQMMPLTDGVAPFQDRVAGFDAEVIKRLAEAGAVLVAKLSLGELAMDDVWFGGQTRNPWNTERGASGSSAGSVSAVAAGLVPFALGTETWGSIISPCNECGTVGLRPTFGRVSRWGCSALAWSMDKIGPIARTVADCAVIFDAIRGEDPSDTSTYDAPFNCDLADPRIGGLRVAYDVAAWETLAAGTDEQRALLPFYDAAKREIERLTGKPLEPVYLPESAPEIEAVAMLVIAVEGAASYAELIAAGGLDKLAQQGADNWPNLFRAAQTIPATEYVQAQRVRAHLQREMESVFEEIDAYLTVPCVGDSLMFTNLCGQPEAITRCGFTDAGMPVMLSVVGSLLKETAVCQIAHAYETAAGWAGRVPAGFD